MNFAQATYTKDGTLAVPKTWLFAHYYDALTTLFRMENALRIFVYIILKNECGTKWCDLSVTSDDSQEGTISSIAKRRQAQAGTFGYLCFPISCPIMHLTSGELVRLLSSDGQWKFFKHYFPASREIVRNKLDEIGCVRNALAHFRPLKPDDVALVKQNAQHVLSEVEKTIEEVCGCFTTVPTNTTDDWYRELTTLRSDHCKIGLTQSPEATWIGISVEYSVPILSKVDYGTFQYVQLLNLSAIPALQMCNDLREKITFANEVAFAQPFDPAGNLVAKKALKFVISRTIISADGATIKADLESLLREVERETELILQDNLAAGKLVRSASIFANPGKENDKDTRLRVDPNVLIAADTGEVPEYWGAETYIFGNYITATARFPWMPMAVSSFDFGG